MDTVPSTKPNIPNIQIFEDIKSNSKLRAFLSEWVMSIKAVYIVLILIIAVELVIGVRALLSPPPQINKLQPVSDGQVVLASDNKSVKVGEEVEIIVKLYTGGHSTVGTDLVLKYDPTFLEASDNFFEEGVAYPDYPGVTSDQNSGELLISGVISPDKKGFNGFEEFGTVKLKALKNGKTQVKVEANSGSTTDSNIIEVASAKDVLAGASSLDVYIGGGAPQSKSDGKNTCSEFTQVCFDDRGKQGTQTCDGGKLNSDMCQFDPDLTQSCTSCQTSN